MAHFQIQEQASFLFKLVSKSCKEYGGLQKAASNKYEEVYGAAINPSPDEFAFLKEEFQEGDVCGACFGVSHAKSGKLFSEQYLGGAVESIFSAMKNQAISRKNIVEVGSLVSCQSPGSGGKLVEMIPWLIWSLGYGYVLITATNQLREIFDAVKIPFEPIVKADPSRLKTGGKSDWGSYYDTGPVTGVIDVRLAVFESMKREFCERFKVNLFDFVIKHKSTIGEIT